MPRSQSTRVSNPESGLPDRLGATRLRNGPTLALVAQAGCSFLGADPEQVVFGLALTLPPHDIGAKEGTAFPVICAFIFRIDEFIRGAYAGLHPDSQTAFFVGFTHSGVLWGFAIILPAAREEKTPRRRNYRDFAGRIAEDRVSSRAADVGHAGDCLSERTNRFMHSGLALPKISTWP
jgi:hypothetical protein